VQIAVNNILDRLVICSNDNFRSSNLSGPLITVGAGVSHLFKCSSFALCNATTSWPDIQIIFLPGGVHKTFAKDMEGLMGVDLSIINKYIDPYVGKDAIMLLVILNQPKSVGELKLKDKSPLSEPLIDPKYFNHPDDMKILLEGCRLTFDQVE